MQRMMVWKALRTLILASYIVEIIKASAVSVPSNIEAQMKVLYTNSNISAPTQVFSFAFSHSNFATVPSFAHGISDFRLYRNLRSVYFITQAINLTQTSVRIQFTIDNTSSTPILRLCINYIAIWNHGGIFVIAQAYSNMANVTSSAINGDRYYQVQELYNFGSVLVRGLPFLKGFYLTTSIVTNISVSITIASSIKYQVRVNTGGDCSVKFVYLDILFYYTDSVTNAAYVYGGDATSFSSSNVNSLSYTQSLTNYSTTVFILGLRGFNAFIYASDIQLGWTLYNVSYNVATFQMNKSNVQETQYSYFQIGQIVAVSTGDAPAETSNYLGIIVGLVVGVAAISVGIVAIVKCYYKSIIYVTPEKNDFRALPALTF